MRNASRMRFRPTRAFLVATPDVANLGLRVARRVLCALGEEERTREYKVTVVGLTPTVQWMLIASHRVPRDIPHKIGTSHRVPRDIPHILSQDP